MRWLALGVAVFSLSFGGTMLWFERLARRAMRQIGWAATKRRRE